MQVVVTTRPIVVGDGRMSEEGRPGTPTPSKRWPEGHIGWTFEGIESFEGRAGSFLAEGGARRERLMFVADDPRTDLWPKGLLERGSLVVLSTYDVYGANRVVDAGDQREAFEGALAEAKAMGYSGLRVAADNTSLIEGLDALDAWIGWETEADALMRQKPITGLCGFDRSRADVSALRAVMGLHVVRVGTGAVDAGIDPAFGARSEG